MKSENLLIKLVPSTGCMYVIQEHELPKPSSIVQAALGPPFSTEVQIFISTFPLKWLDFLHMASMPRSGISRGASIVMDSLLNTGSQRPLKTPVQTRLLQSLMPLVIIIIPWDSCCAIVNRTVALNMVQTKPPVPPLVSNPYILI